MTEGVAWRQRNPEGGCARRGEEESMHRRGNRREEELLVVEGGTGETEAEESHRGNLLKVGEEEEKATCQQDMETAEEAWRPASSQLRFLL